MTGAGDERRALFLGPALSLGKRELVRFYRQRERVAGAVIQPLIFWILFGSGLGTSFRPSGVGSGSLEFLLPGTAVMVVLFTAIFTTISVIEDRSEGFLQAVLAAPVSRGGIIAGKTLGGIALAVPQGLAVLALGPFVGLDLAPVPLLLSAAVLVLLSAGLTGLGLCIAWRMDSTQGFHAIMTVFLFPMWILSGAFFPAAGAPIWLRAIMAANPLTYGVAALRRVLYLGQPARIGVVPPLGPSLGVMAAFALLTLVGATRLAARPARPSRVRTRP